MKTVIPRLFGALAVGLLAASAGAEPAWVNWQDLAPQMAEISNPFERLTNDQLDGLRRIVRLERTDDAEKIAEAHALRAELTAQGLDVDALFAARLEIMEQRRLAAISVNETLIGQEIRIPGYVLPLEMKDRRAVEFLLVPTVGACIHTPPPPANQVIHVMHSEGIEIKGLYDPVWVTGVMEAGQTVQDVRYADGQAEVAVSYAMKPSSVIPY